MIDARYNCQFDRTDMTTSPTADFKLSSSALGEEVPLRRVGTEEVMYLLLATSYWSSLADRKLCYLKDMAGAILYMASRAGAYVNGAVWLVDGGRAGSFSSTSY
jgi:NAD(P)-dependent dehydrogenase (short-subunit alcohol dehydrogenase family)